MGGIGRIHLLYGLLYGITRQGVAKRLGCSLYALNGFRLSGLKAFGIRKAQLLKDGLVCLI